MKTVCDSGCLSQLSHQPYPIRVTHFGSDCPRRVCPGPRARHDRLTPNTGPTYHKQWPPLPLWKRFRRQTWCSLLQLLHNNIALRSLSASNHLDDVHGAAVCRHVFIIGEFYNTSPIFMFVFWCDFWNRHVTMMVSNTALHFRELDLVLGAIPC